MTLRAVLVALSLALATGCQETPPPMSQAPSSPLVPPIRPGGLAPIPEGFQLADELYARGVIAFEMGDFASAAPWLARVAEALPEHAGPYRVELAHNRLFAYRNATIAWLFAGTPEEARKTLDAALVTDIDCEQGIRELLTMLPPVGVAP